MLSRAPTSLNISLNPIRKVKRKLRKNSPKASYSSKL